MRTKIRFVGQPYVFYQHFSPIVCRSPGEDAHTGEMLDPFILQGFEPQERLACFVFAGDEIPDATLKFVILNPASNPNGPGCFDISKDSHIKHKTSLFKDTGGWNGRIWDVEILKPWENQGKFLVATVGDLKPEGVSLFTKDQKLAIRSIDITQVLRNQFKPHTPKEIKKMLADQEVVVVRLF